MWGLRIRADNPLHRSTLPSHLSQILHWAGRSPKKGMMRLIATQIRITGDLASLVKRTGNYLSPFNNIVRLECL
jgi:hypothetical protein